MNESGISISIKDARKITFPSYSYPDWVHIAEKGLKNRAISELYSETLENIQLKPLYINGDIKNTSIPLQKSSSSWKIIQIINNNSSDNIKQQLQETFKNGQKAICFELHPEWSMNDLNEIFTSIDLDANTFFIDGKELTIPFLSFLKKWAENNSTPFSKIKGFIGSDPYYYFFNSQPTNTEAEEYYQQWCNTIAGTIREFPNINPIFVNGMMYKEAGGNAVEELAYTLSVTVENIERLGEKGIQPSEVISNTVVSYAISSEFFMEIAKLRAARYLWLKLQEAYQLNKENISSMKVMAETTSTNKTMHEPYMNMLRTGGEGLAAVIGQVDYLRIHSFDELISEPSSLGKRVSRNIHHILKEEAKLDMVKDPAAGSYLVESLTKELIEKAWSLFLQIQDEGGMFSLLSSGKIQNQLKEQQHRRLEKFYKQQNILIGANRFIDLEQASLLGKKRKEYVAFKMKTQSIGEVNNLSKLGDLLDAGTFTGQTQTILPLSFFRYTETLETSLLKSIQLKESLGIAPTINLISMGTSTKGVIDFVRSYLAAGGVRVKENGLCNSMVDIEELVGNSDEAAYCICLEKVTDESINLAQLKEKFPGKIWGVAFLEFVKVPSFDNYDFVIHPQANQIEVLEKIIDGLGGDGYEA